MKMPGFNAEASLYRMSGHYHGRRAADHDGMALHPAQVIPIGPLCQVAPWLCTAINVYWWPSNNGVNGAVIVTGAYFAANSQVHGTVTNCVGPSPAQIDATTNANGEFQTAVLCECTGSTTVRACDQNGNCADGTSQMPC
jgi:hypothetical protein